MRRARINIKPNVRPGGRAVVSTAQSKTSQESAAVDSTQQTQTVEQIETPSPSPQSHLEAIEPAVATGDGNVPGCPSEKASVNIDKRVPSSGSTPAATALQRRSKISATPNLARPKVRSVPPASTGKTAFLPSQTSKSSPEAAVSAATSRDDSQNSTLSDSILKQSTKTTISPPSSPSLPTSPGFHESPVQKTSPSSTQPQQELYHTPKKSRSGPQEAVSPSSSILSPCIKLSRCDGPESPLKNSEQSDKQRVLRALKLKELMKRERKKLMKRKSRRHMYDHSDEVDQSKMTLADFIYYLPETNPMKSSLPMEQEQTPAENVVPLLPKVPSKLAEPEEEDYGDDDGNDDDDDEMMVPKVRVAEDGTLILDEESLTVRVERTSDTVVDDATPLFERGSTTTYTSFKKRYYVKCWSVRETDMFYLAISMVGTDFSMMAQLLTHRTRAEIKSKYKKEEKANLWRVDKAFKNKRPFDKEFFSFLLQKVLEADKKRGQAIKLVVKSNKANKGKGGKKGKPHKDADSSKDDDDIEDELDIRDNGSLDLEKENEDSNNVKISDVTSSKNRKRKREPKGSPGGKTCKKKKKSKKVKGEESEHLQVEDDSVNAENEDPTLMPNVKKKRKRSRKGDEKRCEEEPEDKHTAKRNKKTVKVPDEEPVDVDGENGQASMEHKTADTSKTCKPSKKSKEENAKGKSKTKKRQESSEECIEDELNTVSSEVSTAGPNTKDDQGEKITLDTTASQEEKPQKTLKRCKRPMPKIPKSRTKKCSVSNEEEDVAPEGQDPDCRETESEFQVASPADSQLQKQAVVVLERTPPRLIKAHSWTVSPDPSQTAQSPQSSPGRQMRAEKVKRNLTGSESERNNTEKMDEYQTASGADTSAKDVTMTALACQDDTQESKEREADKHLVEDISIQHHSQVSTEVNGQTFLKTTPVVKVSHEEVHHYLTVQTKTTEENSSASMRQLDAASAEVENVEEHMDGPVEKCSSGVTLVSQGPGINECASSSSQQCITQKRKRFTKPTPNLSRTQQTMERPLNMQTTEYSEKNPESLRSCPVEDTMVDLNKCPGSPEEHPTSSESLKEKKFQDLRKPDDVETTIDDDLPFVSDEEIPTVSKNIVQKILSILEEPSLSATLSDEDVAERTEPLEMALSENWENKKQITDLEDCEPYKKTMTEEPLELTVPTSYFKQSVEASQCNTELHEDSKSKISDVRGCPSPAEAMYCELDLSMKKNISTEDKQSYKATLQECKQSQEPPSLIQTKGPAVQVNDTAIENKEKSDPVLTEVLGTLPDTCSEVPAEALGASFSEASTKYPSNTCDMNTMLFCGTTAEDIQRSVNFSEENVKSMEKMQHSISDSVKEDKAVNLSKAAEDFSAPSKGNAKSDILDSAGVETDNQTEEEPTFVLTLYEIPTSQLFQEGASMASYELQPAEVHTPCLSSKDSQSLPFTLEESSALLHMKSEKTEEPCKSISEKMVDVLEDAVKDANTHFITSEKSSSDDGGSQKMLLYNESVPTDVTSMLTLEEKPSECTERKACQRRSKIKVKPNLGLCAMPGPSNIASKLKTTANTNIPTSHAIAHHINTGSKQETSVKETDVSFVSTIHSNSKDSKRENHHEGLLTDSMPASEGMKDEVPIMCGSPPKSDLHMGMDTAVDLSVRNIVDVPHLHSTAIEEFREEVKDGCEGVSRVMLVDGLVIASGEMEDKDRLLGNYESDRPLPTFYDQEIFTDISKEQDTYEEALNLTSSSQDRTESFSQGTLEVTRGIDPDTTCNKDESSRKVNLDVRSIQQAITPIIIEHQIKEESDKVKEKADLEDFSDNLKGDTALTEEVLKAEQQLALLTSTCAESQSVEKIEEDDPEDVSHVVLSDIFVAVSEENKDEVHINSESSLLHLHQSCDDPCAAEKEQNLNTDADREVEEHKAVSHIVLGDIFIPVSEKVEDDLGKEGMTIRAKSPHEASKVKEHPLCAVSESTHMGSSGSPRKRTPTKKDLIKMKMIIPKRRKGESSGSVEQSPTSSAEPLSTSMLKQQNISTLKSLRESNSDESESLPPWQQTPSSIKTISCANSPSIDSVDIEEVCEGVSHTVFSDIFVPVSDETAESSIHKETLMVKSLDSERSSNTERPDLPASRSSEQKPSCKRVTQTSQSLEPQAEEEWSLRSDMLPMDSNEIENWCEGVSHMLMSDAFVPVSEEENSTDQKEFVASIPHKDVENDRSRPECSGTTDNVNNEHQVDGIPGMQKPVKKTKEKLLESQTKTLPERQSTLQMTLRSPRRSPKSLNSTQGVPTTPQRASTSKEKKESIQTPTRLPGEEIIRECRIPLERLSVEEICQHHLQPKYHSTPVNLKCFSKDNESRRIGSESHSAQDLTIPSGGWPKVLLNRININATDADMSTSTSSPARVSTTAYQPVDSYQSPRSSPDAGDEHASVSQFFLDNIFTEVEDSD